MPCAGIVVFRLNKDKYETIMVITKYGNYGFPKGKLHKNETLRHGAFREVEEETGLKENEIKLIDNCSFTEKSITYYVGMCLVDKKITFDQNELSEVKWMPVENVLKISSLKFKPIRYEILKNAYSALLRTNDSLQSVHSEKKQEKPIDDPLLKIVNRGREIYISKTLAWILRHKAETMGLKMNDEGYVAINDLLKLDKFENVSVDNIKYVVENNDKQRFTMCERNGDFYIRANQGHSGDLGSKINDEKVLKKILVPYKDCFHGTYSKYLTSIKEKGLSKMNRKHIHLIDKMNAISGMRKNCDIVIHINMKHAMEDGIVFYESNNNIILTEGDINGIIDPKYFDKIETRNN
jgi:2'-phosphotransferase